MKHGHLTFFPQFCRESLNDDAWYPGFTDWDLIKNLPPAQRERFTPAAGYYDLGVDSVIANQMAALSSSSWPAMALYHYFFNGRFVLDNVERYILAAGGQVPPFFLIWANETWSKRWVGKPHQIIIKQTHTLDRSVVDKHVERLTALFRHPAYMCELGRPIFVIYAPFEIPNASAFVRTYREAFARAGVQPLLGFCVPYVDPRFDASEFDFCVEFQPRLFFNIMRAKIHRKSARVALLLKQWAPWGYEQIIGIRDSLRRRRDNPSSTFDYHDYLELMDRNYFSNLLEDTYGKPAYKSLFYSWNNFPRYRGSALVVRHRRDEHAEFLRLSAKLNSERRWYLVNSWNEWSEGAALEPGVIERSKYELVAETANYGQRGTADVG